MANHIKRIKYYPITGRLIRAVANHIVCSIDTHSREDLFRRKTMQATHSLCCYNATQLVQVCDKKELVKAGSQQNELAIVSSNCALVIGLDGKIAYVGNDLQSWEAKQPEAVVYEKKIDCTNKVIMPSLIDAHTHPIWSGSRVAEFAMKLNGASYMEIHNAGGGIHSTVNATNASSESELAALLIPRLDRMLKLGTTLIEAKTGYGLSLEGELKLLRVLHEVSTNANHDVEMAVTYLGAHAIPKESGDAEAATVDIIDNHIPALKKAMDDKVISPEMIDVFCEHNVFSHEQSERIINAGKDVLNLVPNFHGDEIVCCESGDLGVKVNARAISHLEMISEDGIEKMASKGIIGVMLPTTKYILALQAPPVRKMIAKNIPIALGSDFNPNAHCMSLPITMNMACVLYKMTMAEAVVATTINAAASIGRAEMYGSLEVGKYGDFLLLSCPSYEHLIYELGDPPIQGVFKKGKCVVWNE